MSTDAQRPRPHDVVVIGCGLMGAALARTFACHGLDVAVWNRTFERALSLERDRITAVESLAEAVESSWLVVACTDTPQSLAQVVGSVANWDGVTLVNLVTTTPRQTEEVAHQLDQLGGRYLDGSIMCYPAEVGTPAAYFAFSGSAALWQEHERSLSILGPSTFSDASTGMASSLAAGISSFYTPALSAYVAAVTYLRRQGASTGTIAECTTMALDTLRRQVDPALAAIESDDHITDQATLTTFATSIRNRLADLEAAGRPMHVLRATLETLEAAEEAGLGQLGFYAQTKVL